MKSIYSKLLFCITLCINIPVINKLWTQSIFKCLGKPFPSEADEDEDQLIDNEENGIDNENYSPIDWTAEKTKRQTLNTYKNGSNFEL